MPPSVLHLKTLLAWSLKISTGGFQNSETGIIICSNHYSLPFVPQKCLLLNAWCKYLFHIGITLEVSWNETQPFPQLTYSEDKETVLDRWGSTKSGQNPIYLHQTAQDVKIFHSITQTLAQIPRAPKSLTSFHCGTLQGWDNSYWVDFRLLLI